MRIRIAMPTQQEIDALTIWIPTMVAALGGVLGGTLWWVRG